MKKLISILLVAMLIVCFCTPFAAASVSINNNAPFNDVEQSNSSIASDKGVLLRTGIHTITVQAWEVQPGVIRCTILNIGPDALDSVQVFVSYYTSSGIGTATGVVDYGIVGAGRSVYNDFHIGGWSGAVGFFNIVEDGIPYTMVDAAGN